MPPRRNPDLFGNLLLLGVVVAGGVWLAKTIHPGAMNTSPTENFPANTGVNKFNVNDADSNAFYRENIGHLNAHAGFGHLGPGGTFVCGVDMHDTSFLGLGGLATQWQTLGQQPFGAGNDADWTGYGIDFDLPLSRALFTGLEVRFWISDTQGTPFQKTHPIGVVMTF
jgi:hypothetical protein